MKDSIEELELISGLIDSGRMSGIMSTQKIDIIEDAIADAIQSSTNDIDGAIKYILTTHKNLIRQLIKVVAKEYPDKLAYVEKLAALT